MNEPSAQCPNLLTYLLIYLSMIKEGNVNIHYKIKNCNFTKKKIIILFGLYFTSFLPTTFQFQEKHYWTQQFLILQNVCQLIWI